MTTPAAAKLYLAQHEAAMEGKREAVFNPHWKPLDELPTIFGFNNGGAPGWLEAVALAEDGTALAGHICSDEGYMRHDLGILEGTSPEIHELYRQHYPDGYRMEFIPSDQLASHEKFNAAIRACQAKQHAAQHK